MLYNEPSPLETRVLTRASAAEFRVARHLSGHRRLQGVPEGREMTPEQIIEEVKTSNLRGRGGAGFPTGMKWSFVPAHFAQAEVHRGQRRRERARHLQRSPADGERPAPDDRRHADRGPGGGCARGLHLHPRRVPLPDRASWTGPSPRPTQRGYLGKNIQGTGFDFDLYTHTGAGAYECGEESALLESLEGKRGIPRIEAAVSGGGRARSSARRF